MDENNGEKDLYNRRLIVSMYPVVQVKWNLCVPGVVSAFFSSLRDNVLADSIPMAV